MDLREEEFREAARMHGASVYNLALARLRSAADADDVFQNVFLKYLQASPSFDSAEHARAWFVRVTLNECGSFWRKVKRRGAPANQALVDATTSTEVGVGDNMDDVADALALREALARLSPKLRVAVHLYYYEDMTTRQIAQALEIKENAVWARLSQARAKLRGFLSDDEGGGDAHDGCKANTVMPQITRGRATNNG